MVPDTQQLDPLQAWVDAMTAAKQKVAQKAKLTDANISDIKGKFGINLKEEKAQPYEVFLYHYWSTHQPDVHSIRDFFNAIVKWLYNKTGQVYNTRSHIDRLALDIKKLPPLKNVIGRAAAAAEKAQQGTLGYNAVAIKLAAKDSQQDAGALLNNAAEYRDATSIVNAISTHRYDTSSVPAADPTKALVMAAYAGNKAVARTLVVEHGAGREQAFKALLEQEKTTSIPNETIQLLMQIGTTSFVPGKFFELNAAHGKPRYFETLEQCCFFESKRQKKQIYGEAMKEAIGHKNLPCVMHILTEHPEILTEHPDNATKALVMAAYAGNKAVARTLVVEHGAGREQAFKALLEQEKTTSISNETIQLLMQIGTTSFVPGKFFELNAAHGKPRYFETLEQCCFFEPKQQKKQIYGEAMKEAIGHKNLPCVMYILTETP